MANLQIEKSWKSVLADEFAKPYFSEIKKALLADQKAGITIYPEEENIFNAFNHISFDKVKVVILGQDPYHGPGQAHGLSFSVPDGVKFPPSLRNIYKELVDDVDMDMPTSGNLERWVDQGVLLLNAVLTVRAGEAASHAKIWWHDFTDEVIKKISDEKSGVVFLLWGSFAQSKSELIDTTKHHILKAPHPSPLSAHRGFFGCKHFSQVNDLLEQQWWEAIDRSL